MTNVIEFPGGRPARDHGPACGHPSRYQSLGGRILCEQCERWRTGWHPCAFCGVEVPAAVPVCDEHDVLECSDCAGLGVIECPDYNCHGATCDGEGVVECVQCGGVGVVERERGVAL